ncbi:Rieske 2Fe-2S domain-containing protein [Paenarthrobacter nicotinovorans]|uniref:Rieske 2Fe-2S domain-containing protein n=1 Tax=Paenarthrobacter nicotinovorans TaxID=29320 RepID=UPI003A804DC4
MRLDSVVKAIEQFDLLDGLSSSLAKAVGKGVEPRPIRNLLSGTFIGHPLHPMLTDLPIGAWTMAAFLDLAGGRASEPAADALVAVGIATAVPTAAAGLNDWSDTQGKTRRTGVVHGLTNSVAFCFYVSSAIARRSGRRGLGKVLGFAGLGLVTFGGYLGGHLTYADAVNVNKTADRRGPAKWTSVLAEGELPDGTHRKVQVRGVSVLLYRSGTTIRGIDSVCSHMGGPLEEGQIESGCVTCPWHGSMFKLADGSIVRGPATRPQPAYEGQIREGQIQIRRAS